MKKRLIPLLFYILIALLCTFVAVQLVLFRIRVEEPQKQIALVTSVDDLEMMQYLSGVPEDQWLAALKEGGLQAVMVPVYLMDDHDVTQPILDAGLEIAQVGGRAKGGIYFFATKYDTFIKPRLSKSVTTTRETLVQNNILPTIESTNSTLVMVENIMQTGNFIPVSFRLINFDGNMAKCFWLNKAFASKYAALGYSGSEELVNMMFRSVVDRGMTVIWVSPISDTSGHAITDPNEYTKMFRALQERIAPAGYTFGQPSSVPTFRMDPNKLVICGIGIMAAAMIVLECLFHPKRKWFWLALFELLVLECILMPYLMIETQMQILALLASMIFPALAVLFLARQLRDTPVGTHASVLRFAVTLTCCLLIVLWGCLYISAVQTTSLYLLVLRIFRGVKLSQLGVYAFSALAMVWFMLHRPGNSPAKDLRALFPKDNRRVLTQTLTAAAVVLVAGAVYLLRTGDGMLSIPEAELRIRSFLEDTLIYRPRTKEFLIAFPAIAVAFVFASRNNRVWTAMFGLLGGIGFASVANTFCHMRAHFLVSLYRTLLSFAIGLALGILITLIGRLFPIGKPSQSESEAE